MRNIICKGLESVAVMSGFVFGACAGVYVYGSCRGWEGTPYEICGPNTDPLLALSIAVGTVAGGILSVYTVSRLKKCFGGKREKE